MNSGKIGLILGNNSQLTQKIINKKDTDGVFSFQCKTATDGKIIQKEENTHLGKAIYQYSYDSRGRLTEVARNGKAIEQYQYNAQGQRVEDYRAFFGETRQFIYSHDGALIRINDTLLDWTAKGQLQAVYTQNRRTEYEYGDDTRLDKALLPSGDVIRYEYADELMPVTVFAGHKPVFKYVWKNYIRLQRCIDIQNEVTYAFSYGSARTPEAVAMQGQAHAVQKLTGRLSPKLELKIGTDQAGSTRALSLPDGTIIKYLEYDAFGNVTLDTKPTWPFPLGFAGGLNDAYTGFVRFGFRDYDPRFGRFTAKDPAGDTGGDHDLWDYCVDDPINLTDPTGLIAPIPLLLAGLIGSFGLGLGGSYGAAAIADAIKSGRDGKEGAPAKDAVIKVAPEVYKAHRAGFLPGEIALGGALGKLRQILLGKIMPEFVLQGKGDVMQEREEPQ